MLSQFVNNIKDEFIADQDVTDKRKEICKNCHFVVLKQMLCGKCLCPVINITKIKNHKCPLGKW